MKNRIFRYELLLLCVVLITASHNAYKVECLTRIPDYCCECTAELYVNEAIGDFISNGVLKNTFIMNVKFNMNNCTNNMVKGILGMHNWKGDVVADPTRSTKNINDQEDSSAMNKATVRDLALSKDEASKLIDEATYKAILNTGIVTLF